MKLLDRALTIAVDAHSGQRNKHDNSLYIQHPLEVWRLCRDEGLDVKHQAVALLHDVVEDSHWTLNDLMRWFLDQPDIVAAVGAITKVKGETNEEYYERLKECPIAARVKLRDMQHNFSRNHQIEDVAKRARMASKYSLGMDRLSSFRVPPVD